MPAERVTGVVLAAGHSRRLGSPKQLLPYRDTTVLGASLDAARACGFDQLIVTLGGAHEEVRRAVPLEGVEAVIVEDRVAEDHGPGCSSSLRIALAHVDPDAGGIVLMLGDQPTMAPATVKRLLDQRHSAPIVVCRYDDGVGHPFWLSRDVFVDLGRLHGDKGVWKLIEERRPSVYEVPVDGMNPLDVDTWDDYDRLLASVVP
jgi:molybdenum cofactor cytidylyltransferase